MTRALRPGESPNAGAKELLFVRPARLTVESDEEVRGLTVVGLPESLQNFTSGSDGIYKAFQNGPNLIQLLEDIKKAEPEVGQAISYDQIKVYEYGDTAVVSRLMVVTGKGKDGKDYANRYRHTVTRVKQQNKWRTAAIRVSRMRV